MTEVELTSRVITAFIAGLIIIFVTAKIVGSGNKAKWFKKRQKISFFNMRGILGDVFHFGYPCTWQGVLVATVMYSIIFSLGYYIIFKY